jgi:hypothetical protein
VNRLIAYARVEKGQHWLEPLVCAPDRMDVFTSFRATVMIPPHDWATWHPYTPIILHARRPERERYLARDDWSQVTEFMNSEQRPNLVLELLANAESLLYDGIRRSAVIEGVSALEIAISDFAKAPRLDALEIPRRVPTETLKDQIEALGLRGSVRYLLPLLFSSDILADSVLTGCQAAVNARNDLVHHGRRDVSAAAAQTFLRALREACQVLANYSNGRGEGGRPPAPH